MIKKILVGYDGSDPSLRAIEYGAELAKDLGSEVLILSVVPELPFTASENFTNLYMPKLEEELNESYGQKLKDVVRNIRKSHPGVKLSSMMEKGKPSDKIIQVAGSEGVDLIVVGNKGTGGLVNWLLGSTSRRVADACTVPVLVVKDREFCELK
jgi:nucleotide-binding universal stress UspA family protein